MYHRPLLSVSAVFWQKVTKLFGQFPPLHPRTYKIHTHTVTPSPHGLNVLATGKIRHKSWVVYHLTKHSRFSPRPEVESLFYYPPPLTNAVAHYNYRTTIVCCSIDIFLPNVVNVLKIPSQKTYPKIDISTHVRYTKLQVYRIGSTFYLSIYNEKKKKNYLPVNPERWPSIAFISYYIIINGLKTT